VYGRIPASHIAGVVALAALVPISLQLDLLSLGWLTSAIMLAVGIWEGWSKRLGTQAETAGSQAHK
jgi:low temperature requirement protein LtrA